MPKSGWRKSHGAAKDGGSLVASEAIPSDELSPARASETARADRDASGRFVPGNRTAKARRLRPSARGALLDLEAKADPAYRAAMKWARRYGAHRRSELTLMFGAISSAVGSLVESESMLLGSARYWHARGMAESSPEFVKLAATLEAQARGSKRDAWELSARESAARIERQGDDLARRQADFQKQLAERAKADE